MMKLKRLKAKPKPCLAGSNKETFRKKADVADTGYKVEEDLFISGFSGDNAHTLEGECTQRIMPDPLVIEELEKTKKQNTPHSVSTSYNQTMGNGNNISIKEQFENLLNTENSGSIVVSNNPYTDKIKPSVHIEEKFSIKSNTGTKSITDNLFPAEYVCKVNQYENSNGVTCLKTDLETKTASHKRSLLRVSNSAIVLSTVRKHSSEQDKPEEFFLRNREVVCSSSSKVIYSIPKTEDIDCEFQIGDVKGHISKPRPHQPLPGKLEYFDEKGNKATVLQVHLPFIPNKWRSLVGRSTGSEEIKSSTSSSIMVPDTIQELSKDDFREFDLAQNNPQEFNCCINSTKSSEEELVQNNPLELKHIDAAEVYEEEPTEKISSIREKTKTDCEEIRILLPSKFPVLLKKHRKCTPVLNKLRNNFKCINIEQNQIGTSKNEAVYLHKTPVQFIEPSKRGETVPFALQPQREKENIGSTPQTVTSLLAKPKYQSGLHKQLLPKPIPKVIETRKFSNEGGRDSVPVSSPNFRPKYITSQYGKTSYDMKQKYLNKYGGETPDPEKLTMLDLIFFNPKNNPMPKEEAEKVTVLPSVQQDEAIDMTSIQQFPNRFEIESKLEEELVDDVVTVPQLKVDKDGNIIIDPATVVNTVNIDDEIDSSVPQMLKVNPKKHEGKSSKWSYEDTIKFYKALHTIGADFSSMAKLFPERSRKILKSKFKREEKKHGSLIDKVLKNPGNFNVNALEKELGGKQNCIKRSTTKRKLSKESKARGVIEDEAYDILIKHKKIKNPPKSPGTLTLGKDICLPIGGTDFSLLKASRDFIRRFTHLFEDKVGNTSVTQLRSEKGVHNDFDRKELFRSSKKPIQRKFRHRANQERSVRNLQAIIADEESIKVDSLDVSSPVKENQIVINTNIHYGTLNITKSISYGAESFGSPVDVNITIEHNKSEEKSFDSTENTLMTENIFI